MFSSLFGWIRSILGQIQRLFGFGGLNALTLPPETSHSNMMSIFVRTNIGEKVQVLLAPDWSVAQIKEQLGPQLHTSSQHIRLIFAGKELPDNLVLRECDLGQNSVLHAVIVVASTTDLPVAAECITGVQLSEDDATEAHIRKKNFAETNTKHEAVSSSDILHEKNGLRRCTNKASEGNSTGDTEETQEQCSVSQLNQEDLSVNVVRIATEMRDDTSASGAPTTNSPHFHASGPVLPVSSGSGAPPANTEDSLVAVLGSSAASRPDTDESVEAASSAGPDPRPCQRLLCDASTVITIQLTQEEQQQLKLLKETGAPGGCSGARPHFYVYCVSPCGGVRPGKLRVRCASCRQGAVTLSSDPTCWEDVLRPHRILCQCATPACSESSDNQYAEFYFKCGEHVTAGEQDEAVPLYMIRANLPGVVCLSCGDVATPVIVFECEASHAMCLDCFVTYCLSKLNERQFTYDPVLGYTLPCPVNCLDSLIVEVHHFRLLGERQYQRYQHWATEEAVLAAGGVLCPQPGCGHGLLPDSDCVRITCVGGCGFVFCRNCLREYHTGDCWQPSIEDEDSSTLSATAAFAVNVSRSTTLASWDVMTASAIQRMTKPCPACHTPTERSGGCMHMVCTRASCRFNWCWVCHTEWSRDCMASHWFG